MARRPKGRADDAPDQGQQDPPDGEDTPTEDVSPEEPDAEDAPSEAEPETDAMRDAEQAAADAVGQAVAETVERIVEHAPVPAVEVAPEAFAQARERRDTQPQTERPADDGSLGRQRQPREPATPELIEQVAAAWRASRTFPPVARRREIAEQFGLHGRLMPILRAAGLDGTQLPDPGQDPEQGDADADADRATADASAQPTS